MTAPAAAIPRTARRTARVDAQAKVNLYLRVLAREASGYHQLETLFQRLDLADHVRVRVGVPGRTLDCDGPAMPADGLGPTERNLAWRAAVAYAAATGWPDGFAIEVRKHVPAGGGLGGGSADAGAVLRCLNALAPRPLDAASLLRLAMPLGADVPFLTTDAPRALAWGRGERMLRLPALPPRAAHLALFAEGVNTADAFRALAARRGDDAAPRPILWSAERFATWDDVALVAVNDFERVVFDLRPDVREMRDALSGIGRQLLAQRQAAQHAAVGDATAAPPTEDAPGDSTPFALMSGSGATVALFTPLTAPQVILQIGPGEQGALPRFRFEPTLTAERVAAVEVSE